jgi:hypothetical protein
MTTFTTEDRKAAYDPGLTCVVPSSATGMEDFVSEENVKSWLEEYQEYKTRHLNTSKKIIEFMKGPKC